MKHLLTLLIFLLFSTHLYADTTVIMTDRETQSLLKESRIYFDQENLDFEAIKEKPFHSFHQEHINRAFDAMTVVWVYLELKNSEAFSVERVLEIDNPLIETITLYESYQTRLAGMLKIQKDQHHLRPSFLLQWQAGEVKKVWIRLKNENTALQFGIHLKTLDKMYHDDYTNQYTITIFLGIILAFLTYALFLFFYTRDTSYLFYAFYLSTLIFQQMTYVGFLPLHAPEWFTKIDSQIVVPKVGIMIIAAVWFAQSFLKTKAFPILHKVYNGITLVILIQMPLVGTSWFYLPELTVLTGLFFIVFNTYAGIYVYAKGNKQARFFIAGWVVLIVAYLMMIFDALGVISVMHLLPSLLMWATAFEALFLMLAFVDKLSILQHEKNMLNAKLLQELDSRNKIVNEQVQERTFALNIVVDEKKALLKELHHRVKNNLQLILSLIRIQSQSLPCDEKEIYFTELENRIKAIAKTHESLYLNDNIDAIDMQEYIESLVNEIHMGYARSDVEMKVKADAIIPIREAVYIGLIINELVTNSMKYAFREGAGHIDIMLTQEANTCQLVYQDSGKGYEESEVRSNAIGLDLVASLVQIQLEGSYEVVHQGRLKYTIGFEV